MSHAAVCGIMTDVSGGRGIDSVVECDAVACPHPVIASLPLPPPSSAFRAPCPSLFSFQYPAATAASHQQPDRPQHVRRVFNREGQRMNEERLRSRARTRTGISFLPLHTHLLSHLLLQCDDSYTDLRQGQTQTRMSTHPVGRQTNRQTGRQADRHARTHARTQGHTQTRCTRIRHPHIYAHELVHGRTDRGADVTRNDLREAIRA